MHEELGYKNPKINEDYNVKLVLLAVKKKLGAKVDRKTAMTPELLLSMHSKLVANSDEDAVVWAIILVAFFGLLRVSNVLAPSKDGFELGKHLARGGFWSCW